VALSVVLVRGLIEAVELVGFSRQAFLDASGFDAERLDVQDARLELEEFDALVEVALDLTGEPSLGLRMGSETYSITYGVAATVVAHATTLRDAVDALLRYQRLLSDHAGMELKDDGRRATLAYQVDVGPSRCRKFRAEVWVAGSDRLVRYFSSGKTPLAACFEYEAPPDLGEYERLFEGRARFGREFTGVVFDRELLSVVQLNHDSDFHATLAAQAERRVARLVSGTSFAERVRVHIVEGHRGRRDMASTARALGTSVRSLRRRLAEEGETYGAVVERALAALAKRLLSDETRSLEEIAYELEFSTSSSFHRAFKRWTGLTPSEFRKERSWESRH